MGSIGLRALRQDAPEIVRRVERGEEVEITDSGRVSARLMPPLTKRWRRWIDTAQAFAGPGDRDRDCDNDLIDTSMVDPWEDHDRKL